jgi:hypothetical protein
MRGASQLLHAAHAATFILVSIEIDIPNCFGKYYMYNKVYQNQNLGQNKPKFSSAT